MLSVMTYNRWSIRSIFHNDAVRALVIIGVWALELANIVVNMVIRDQPTDPAINLVFTTVIGAILTDRTLHKPKENPADNES